MCVKIENISEREIRVNNKLVYKDMNDRWVAQKRMTLEEAKFFNEFVLSLGRCARLNKATYYL